MLVMEKFFVCVVHRVLPPLGAMLIPIVIRMCGLLDSYIIREMTF